MELIVDPNKKQEQALLAWADDTTQEILYGGAKNGGKSFLGATAIFHDALVYPETMYFIARETLADLRKYTIPTINEVFQKWKLDISKYAPYNGQDNFFKCYNGSRVHLIECRATPSDPLFERFGSMQMTRGWIEEVGEVAELAKINLGLSLGRWKNDQYKLVRKLLMTCNPKKNWLKYNYIDPFVKGELPETKKVILATVYDNKHRQKGSEKVLEELTGTARQRLYLGKWDYDSDDDCLIDGERILDLYTNKHVGTGEDEDQDFYITGDIARFGKDKTVFMVWKGFRLIHVEIIIHAKTTESSQALWFLIQKYRVPLSNVIIDEDGVGGGVVDQVGCVGFVNNSTPLPNPEDPSKKENYFNLKSQCYYMTAEMVNRGEMYIEANLDEYFHGGHSVKELLNQELENVRKKEVDSDKKLQVMPKDKIVQLIGRSPDFADCFMMRQHARLIPARTWTIV